MKEQVEKKWKFVLAIIFTVLLAGGFSAVVIYATYVGKKAGKKEATGIPLNVIQNAAKIQSGNPDGAGPLVMKCKPHPRFCAVRFVSNNQGYVMYLQAIGGVWTTVEVDNLTNP